MRPWLPSQYSVLSPSSARECRAQNSASTTRVVLSSAIALAPFSQNSAGLRLPVMDSGQAQPGQSKPSRWLTRSIDLTVRLTPAWDQPRSNATVTALTPAAERLGGWIWRSSSLMSCSGACLFMSPSLQGLTL
ncbi:hypothetical protein AHiyo8_22690 [Arthrobacter sp. Hiyo8]|nr:hypothetical protein AHiyo8_22690 [Arthrobacter sp. Hiyo8]